MDKINLTLKYFQVDLYVSRDLDSRSNERELAAVQEWLHSSKGGVISEGILNLNSSSKRSMKPVVFIVLITYLGYLTLVRTKFKIHSKITSPLKNSIL